LTLIPGTRLGPYEITAHIGAGGMGEVYRATDSNLKRPVAIKVLPASVATDADRLARFQREAEVLAALNHPNIAAIYGLEKTREFTALVMELVEGEDLSTHIARGPMPLAESLSIARQIADALEAAHDQGIIHRDLKPANVKVRTDGTVKVLDFGLAKALAPPSADASAGAPGDFAPTMTSPAMTQAGMILGTAAYMAPEQARGRPIDRRADIWAFGVVLFELLSGRRAFEGDDVSITIANVLKEDVAWSALPADLPASVRRLLRRCLEKDPKRRLSAIGDARLELDEPDAPASASVTSARSSKPGLVPWIIASLAALAALALGIFAFSKSSEPATAVWTSIPAPVSEFGRGGLAVSPDGRLIVYVAPDETGTDVLWVRALESQSPQFLAGTETALHPFWSPDNQSIGFFKGQKLMTVSAAGGPPTVVDDAPNARGGSLNADGVIVFVPAPGAGLYRVASSTGGAVSPVTLTPSIDLSTTLLSWPSFLPDGQHFLYTSARDGEAWINVGSLADMTTVPLLQAFSRAQYAGGYLLFGSKGEVYAHPFDASTRKLSGERVRVIAPVGFSSGNTQNYAFSSSASGSVMAAAHSAYVPLSQLTWFDRSGTRLETLGEAAYNWGFAVDPGRTRIVAERHDVRLNSMNPWVVQLSTGFTTPLRAVAEGALASNPTWSHDGNRVFYSSGYGTLRVASIAGGPEQAWPVGSHWPNSSSRDGAALLISRQGSGSGNDLMIVPMAGDHTPAAYLQTPFNEYFARFSPNGRWVAYVSDESTRNEVYVESYPRSASKARVSTAGGTFPEWSEDGRELYFFETRPDGTRTMMVSSVIDGRASPPVRLFDLPAARWEANRSQFAVFDAGRRFLVNVPLPTTGPQVITVGQHWTSSVLKK